MPCDQGRPDPTSIVRPCRLQGKTVWEHSPTRRKYLRLLRLNRGAPLRFHSVTVPPLLPGPTIPVGPPHAILTCHVAPLTSVRVAPFAWPAATRQRHLRLAWATQAMPRGLSAASHLEAVPRATSAAARHVTLQVKTPFFAIFK